VIKTILAVGAISILALGAAEAESAKAQSGIASVYAYRGSKTASGEHMQPTNFTAAHRSLPFGTMVRVSHRKNGRSVVVRINDRGPFIRAPAAARALGISGLAPVTLSAL
jgi:rare lipoprotein A